MLNIKANRKKQYQRQIIEEIIFIWLWYKFPIGQIVRDGVFTRSEFNEVNTSSAKTSRDLGPKRKRQHLKGSGIVKPKLPTICMRKRCLYLNTDSLATQLTSSGERFALPYIRSFKVTLGLRSPGLSASLCDHTAVWPGACRLRLMSTHKRHEIEWPLTPHFPYGAPWMRIIRGGSTWIRWDLLRGLSQKGSFPILWHSKYAVQYYCAGERGLLDLGPKYNLMKNHWCQDLAEKEGI